ncbi:MAG: HAD family hydrolase [Vicinamibacterales bacterium]
MAQPLRSGQTAGAQPAGSSRPVRAVIFDLDGTLYRASAVRRGMTIRLLSYMARRPFDGLRTVQLISAYRQAQESLRAAGNPIGPNDQLALACRVRKAEPAWAARAVQRWMEEAPLDLVRRHTRVGVTQCLHALRGAGIRVGLFSDYPPQAKLEAMGIRELFDVVRWAQEPEIAAFKPDPRGLLATLNALDVAPADALYVGDRPETDGQAARSAGVRAAIIGQSSTDPAGDWMQLGGFAELTHSLLAPSD